MEKPNPEVGLVIRYDFLWSHEREKGRREGAKERPCAVAAMVIRDRTGEPEVLVVPITHSPPRKGAAALEIPHELGRRLGLDDGRSYIIADEANSVAWDDPGTVPAVAGERWAHGRLPKTLYDQLRTIMLGLVRERKLKTAERTTVGPR